MPTPDFDQGSTSSTSTDGASFLAGDVLYHPPSKLLYVLCSDGEWLGVCNLGFPTKKILNAAGFANGYGVRKQGGRFGTL